MLLCIVVGGCRENLFFEVGFVGLSKCCCFLTEYRFHLSCFYVYYEVVEIKPFLRDGLVDSEYEVLLD